MRLHVKNELKRMADENQNNQNPSDKTDESKNTENKSDEHMIPKSRFDEVNTRAKDAEAKLAQLQAEKAEAEKKALEESGKYKELWEQEQAEKNRLSAEVLKGSLIQEAITNKKLHPSLTRMVNGTTKEEIEQSITDALKFQEEFQTDLKENTKAKDDAGNGKHTSGAPMSQQEYMELLKKDPAEAKRRLKEISSATAK